MEELALRAQPLHHVDALTAEEAHVAAADVGWELFSKGALWENERNTCSFIGGKKQGGKKDKHKRGKGREGKARQLALQITDG